jgi:hypothetical protein
MLTMTEVYYQLVKTGKKSIDQVPTKDGIQEAVTARLSAEQDGQA